MKTLISLLMLTCLALGGICAAQWQQLAARHDQIVALRSETEGQSKRIHTLEAAKERSDQQQQELRFQADNLVAQLQGRAMTGANVALGGAAGGAGKAGLETTAVPDSQGLAAAADTGKTNRSGLGSLLSTMLQDPETKKFIRDQQRMMMDQLYAPLVKQMGLSSDEAGQFKDLLADTMMQGADKASALFGGASGKDRAEVVKTMEAEQKSADDQIKAFLGDARYAQYKEYQQTVGERTQLNLFRQQAGSDVALTDQQTEQLLAVMKEEKQNATASLGAALAGKSQGEAGLQEMLSGEQADKLIQAQETVNQRVYERAQGILGPGQLSAFGTFQTNQLQMMRMGMGMARKMFAPDGGE